MAEVLSQSQIDALLNSMLSGDKTAAPVEEKQEKKYRKYDFSNPRKFAKDRIKMLNSIFENYARVIGARLSALLRTNCEASVETIEEQRYYEFSNALTEGDVLAMVEVRIKDEVEESPAMFYISTSMALGMMDRMMGGEGEVDSELPSEYSYTDLELRLYESLMNDMVSIMGSSWENYISIGFSYSRTEVNPTMVQVLGLDEIVIIVDLSLQFPNSSGRLSVCLPAVMLTNVFAEISRENPGRKVMGENKSEEIFDKLRDSSLEIVAQLGDTQLALSDLYHLNVGDVVNLGRSKDEPILLEIGGYQWFTGRIGTHKKNMAVKIDDVRYLAEQRSE